ncbi:hypothetical protein [Ramlibacter sp.]|uniref:hypothetical protein n=1 Tax=Ramlibacter sp. TaxID=1917967 RepID=UPI002D095D5D|nr:hypothetical protein [Ramlibacter sp.]HWI80419.1 hypothetical protein [Ramlibacter sp.]
MRDPLSRVPYRSVRLRYCRSALRAFQRRWFASMVVALAVAGIGGPAMAAGVVLPLYWALAHGSWIWAAVLGYAVAGGGLVWAMRPLLWNPQWAQAERALPIRRRDQLLSDLQVVAFGLTPLTLLCAAGTAVIVSEDPGWFRPLRTGALVALSIAVLASAVVGVALLQYLRCASADARQRSAPRAGAADGAVATVPWAAALVWTPLVRGPARQTRRALVRDTLALLLPCAGSALWSAHAGWWAAGYSALSLVAVSRCSAIARREFAALLPACLALPLDIAILRRIPSAIALLPALVTMPMLVAQLFTSPARAAVVWAYAAASITGWTVEAFIVQTDPAAKAARWLVTLALGVALASELAP